MVSAGCREELFQRHSSLWVRMRSRLAGGVRGLPAHRKALHAHSFGMICLRFSAMGWKSRISGINEVGLVRLNSVV